VKLEFDRTFYTQRNGSDFGPIPLIGTSTHPVKEIGLIDHLEIYPDILCTSTDPANSVTLRLIISPLGRVDFPERDVPYCMQFLFYDFEKNVHLFLFNANVNKILDMSKNERKQRFSLTIVSTKSSDGFPAYRVVETNHKEI
jgi:hypothetical protein